MEGRFLLIIVEKVEKIIQRIQEPTAGEGRENTGRGGEGWGTNSTLQVLPAIQLLLYLTCSFVLSLLPSQVSGSFFFLIDMSADLSHRNMKGKCQM